MSVEELGAIICAFSAGTIFGFMICAWMVNAKREDDTADQTDEKRRLIELVNTGVIAKAALDLNSGSLTVTVMPPHDDGGDR